MLLYLSFIISFFARFSASPYFSCPIPTFLLPIFLHCASAFSHHPHCLSSVFVTLFFGSSLRPIHLPLLCWPSAFPCFPSSLHSALLSVRWENAREEESFAPRRKRCQMSGSLTHWERTAVFVCVCQCVCEWQGNSRELKWRNWKVFVKPLNACPHTQTQRIWKYKGMKAQVCDLSNSS